ncbi:MAG: hypothetical protein PVJ67_06440 [Candidatus Pacearchaeota archaeon]|jgi:hypothetical protein
MENEEFGNFEYNSVMKLEEPLEDFTGRNSRMIYLTTKVELSPSGNQSSYTEVRTASSYYMGQIDHKCFESLIETINHALTGHQVIRDKIKNLSENKGTLEKELTI